MKNLFIYGDCSILDAMKVIDNGGVGALFVLDDDGHMLGMVTDGDIRKAILRGVDVTSSLLGIINRNYKYGRVGQTPQVYFNILRKIRRRHLPILDEQGKLADIFLLDNYDFYRNDTLVVLMVGGRGSRLGSLTDETPKPMLKIGDKPILEHIIDSFVQQGFYRFVLCVNYKSEIIKEYFKDGSQVGVDITYTEEEKNMGTAGALSLLPERPAKPFIVMNGDLITNFNYEKFLEFHSQQESVATMAARKYDVCIPFGVIKHEGYQISSIVEKPTYEYYVNGGIYILDPMCLNHIPTDSYFDMTALFDRLIAIKEKTAIFPINDYWLDIGRPDDFIKANLNCK